MRTFLFLILILLSQTKADAQSEENVIFMANDQIVLTMSCAAIDSNGVKEFVTYHPGMLELPENMLLKDTITLFLNYRVQKRRKDVDYNHIVKIPSALLLHSSYLIVNIYDMSICRYKNKFFNERKEDYIIEFDLDTYSITKLRK